MATTHARGDRCMPPAVIWTKFPCWYWKKARIQSVGNKLRVLPLHFTIVPNMTPRRFVYSIVSFSFSGDKIIRHLYRFPFLLTTTAYRSNSVEHLMTRRLLRLIHPWRVETAGTVQRQPMASARSPTEDWTQWKVWTSPRARAPPPGYSSNMHSCVFSMNGAASI